MERSKIFAPHLIHMHYGLMQPPSEGFSCLAFQRTGDKSRYDTGIRVDALGLA